MREDAVTTQLSNSSRPHPATCPPLIDNPAFLALDIHSLAIDRRRQDLLACSAACAECPKVDTFSSSLEQRDDTGVDGTRSTSLNGDSSSASTADKGRSELARALPPNTVYLHVYDLDPTISKYVNKVMRPLGAGAFHAGVEVYGIEYCYGQTCGKPSLQRNSCFFSLSTFLCLSLSLSLHLHARVCTHRSLGSHVAMRRPACNTDADLFLSLFFDAV